MMLMMISPVAPVDVFDDVDDDVDGDVDDDFAILLRTPRQTSHPWATFATLVPSESRAPVSGQDSGFLQGVLRRYAA